MKKKNADSIELLELYDEAENNKEVISELEKNILELTEMILKSLIFRLFFQEVKILIMQFYQLILEQVELKLKTGQR